MIVKIEIHFFRSIYKASIADISELSVFTGKNDVGKSNILKALNLFFNNYIVKLGDYSFAENFNQNRLNEVRETIKGKQYIQIRITFKRGNTSEQTLPEYFTVTKRWNRDSDTPIVTDDVERRMHREKRQYSERSKASVTRYLNRCKYIYVPAIKDERIFASMLNRLQDEVFVNRLGNDEKLISSMSELAELVSTATSTLSEEFYKVTNIESSIETPTNTGRLYQSLNIVTKNGENEVLLKNRGDGLQVRYLPSILHYLSLNSNERFIWGFEEPENSLEFNMARDMAEDFYDVYRKNSQIFITTHSPAFIDLGGKEFGSGYRCFVRGTSTAITSFEKERDEELLSEELGYARILQKQYEQYKMKKLELEEMNREVIRLNKELLCIHRPVLLTEGKTDAVILSTAWNKLYDEECPFEIKSCSLNDSDQETAGCSVLATILKGIRSDSEKKTIGLFDNDDAGMKSFQLDNNYHTVDTYKVNKNKKGFAMIIPASTPILSEIAQNKNLSIEFLFSKEDLEKEVNGKKLEIEPAKAYIVVNGQRMREVGETTYWYMGKIASESKKDFANFVVPSFEKESFVNFIPLFETVLKILKDA